MEKLFMKNRKEILTALKNFKIEIINYLEK